MDIKLFLARRKPLAASIPEPKNGRGLTGSAVCGPALPHVLRRARRIVSICLIPIACAPAMLTADQSDPRLEALFFQLQSTADAEIGDAITGQIWEIWKESPDETINELMRSGMFQMSRGRLRRAIISFDRIVAIAPEFAEGWNKRATVYFFLGEYDKSVADVRQTLLLEPRHFGAVAGMGMILLQRKQYDSALRAFRKALEINPHLPGPRIQVKRLEKLLKQGQI